MVIKRYYDLYNPLYSLLVYHITLFMWGRALKIMTGIVWQCGSSEFRI